MAPYVSATRARTGRKIFGCNARFCRRSVWIYAFTDSLMKGSHAITIKRILGMSAMLVLVVVAHLFFDISQRLEKARSDDPLVWASDIETFAKGVVAELGSLLSVGSPSIRFLGELAEDMAQVPVVKRGFGGPKIGDVVYYADCSF